MNNIKAIRKEKGLTQAELARRYSLVLGKDETVKTSTISQLERSDNLKPITVTAMAQALGVSPSNITGGSLSIAFEEDIVKPLERLMSIEYSADILKKIEQLEHEIVTTINHCNDMLSITRALTEKVLNAGKDESQD